ncbi:MAG: hypothetical protein WBW84_21510 [Acidobacteriaceae bacterium]
MSIAAPGGTGTLSNSDFKPAMWWPMNPQMNPAGYHADAPWLFTALANLRDLEGDPKSLTGFHTLIVQPHTAGYTRSILGALNGRKLDNLPAPRVAPIEGGGVGLAWSVGKRDVEMVVYPDNLTTYVFYENDEAGDEGEFREPDVIGLEKALQRLISC